MLMQIWADEDRTPPWDGELELRDAETGARHEAAIRRRRARALHRSLRRVLPAPSQTAGAAQRRPVRRRSPPRMPLEDVDLRRHWSRDRGGSQCDATRLHVLPQPLARPVPGGLRRASRPSSVALYLLDRSRRKQVVSTLRFWVAAEQPAVAARRRRIQQPWSLLLQLLSMALLLLAIAQLRFGTPGAAPAAITCSCSIPPPGWRARSGNRTLMDLARERARAYLQAAARARPRHAGARRRPGHARHRLRTGSQEGGSAPFAASQPGSTALNLDQALAFARHMQAQDGRRAGEIVFVGTGRTARRAIPARRACRRICASSAVPDTVENCRPAQDRHAALRRRFRRLGNLRLGAQLRHAPAQRHPGARFRTSGHSRPRAAGSQPLTLPPGAEARSDFRIPHPRRRHARRPPHAARRLSRTTITPNWNCPRSPRCTSPSIPTQPELLRPVLAATPRVTAVYRSPAEYTRQRRAAW